MSKRLRVKSSRSAYADIHSYLREHLDIAPDRLDDEVEALLACAEYIKIERGKRRATLAHWARQRAHGVPVAHITGASLFLGRWFKLDSTILAPHPATKLLTLLCLRFLDRRRPTRLGFEIGLGSGVISISLASAIPELEMIGTELSERSAQFTRENAHALLGAQSKRLIVLRVSDEREVLEPLMRYGRPKADFLISNPPYLAVDDEISDEYRNNMPSEALYGPAGDSLHFYKAIASHGASLLRPKSPIFLECRASRSEDVKALFQSAGFSCRVYHRDDAMRELTQSCLEQLSSSEKERQFANHAFIVATAPD